VDAVLRYTLPTQTTFRAAFSYVDDILIYSRSDPSIDSHLDDFALLDLRLEQPFAKDRILLYVGVENVLDESWSYNFGFPGAGRTVFGGVELRY
jgi:outer membrane receptor protein involved in Fe transport